MAYWWVNQNQTAKHEISGGYMWSPKRNQNNSYNQFYENMHLVETGDVVFSYYDQRIQHLGIVRHPAVSGNKPADFGLTGEYWSNEGWFVPVEWHRVLAPYRPKEMIETLRPHLPEKYSPLNRNTGDGLQSVYLAAVPESMAEALFRPLNDWGREFLALAHRTGDDDGAVRKLDDSLEQAIRNDTNIDDTERAALINARRGQGRFRQNLERVEQRCRISGVTDRRLLKASHIKPWRSCANNHERLDGNNGLLLAPHIDHLFDRGYISFSADGRLLVSSRIDPTQLELLGIRTRSPFNVGAFGPEQMKYLEYHRNTVLLP